MIVGLWQSLIGQVQTLPHAKYMNSKSWLLRLFRANFTGHTLLCYYTQCIQPINPSNPSPEQKDELIPRLFDHIGTLSNKIKSLKAQLFNNSRNSSKPSSSDGYGKPKSKSRRKISTNRSVGQTGNKGHTLKQVEHPEVDIVDIFQLHVSTAVTYSIQNVTHSATGLLVQPVYKCA